MAPGRMRPCLSGLLLCAAAAAAAGTDGERRAGDTVSHLLPAGVLAAEAWRGDREGMKQFGLSFVATVTAAELLKRSTGVERPDHSNDQSFPSGHAARAFAAATFVHRRHGAGAALPLYALATYVGHTRVQAGRHRWADVVGAAALAVVASRTFAEPSSASAARDRQRISMQWSMPLK